MNVYLYMFILAALRTIQIVQVTGFQVIIML